MLGFRVDVRVLRWRYNQKQTYLDEDGGIVDVVADVGMLLG